MGDAARSRDPHGDHHVGDAERAVAVGGIVEEVDEAPRPRRLVAEADRDQPAAVVVVVVGDLARGGASVLIASAEFPEMLKLCDRIYCIADGSLRRCLTRDEFSEERLLLEVN